MFYPVKDHKFAFVDETGNFGFDFSKSGTSSHFIITAIIVDKDKVTGLKNNFAEIKTKYFPQGEMKSSSIGKNHERRFKIISDINNLDFTIFALVVDKKKIYDGSGIKFKKTFIKYLNKILYQELKLLYPFLKIFADTHGSEKFMGEFEKYVLKSGNISFFDEFSFEFANSEQEVLIQLADFISGTISFGYEEEKICKEYKGYYNFLKSKIIGLKQWPLTYENYLRNLDLIDKSQYDEKIAQHCLRLASSYIQRLNKSKDNEDIDRVCVLEYLINQIYAFDPFRYISAKELRRYLNNIRNCNYDDQAFKTNIIAHYRDNDVIISSSSNGYKVPVSEKELYSYTNRTMGIISPMLERLYKCRNRVLTLTDNQLDILDSEEYINIKRYFDEIHNKQHII